MKCFETDRTKYVSVHAGAARSTDRTPGFRTPGRRVVSPRGPRADGARMTTKKTIKQLAAEPRPDVVPEGYIYFRDYLAKKEIPSLDKIHTKLRTGELTAFYVDRFFHPFGHDRTFRGPTNIRSKLSQHFASSRLHQLGFGYRIGPREVELPLRLS